MKESDLFPAVKQWLEERDYEVFSEVMPARGGSRADVVGAHGPAIAVVEMKTSLSLDVIEQAVHWKPYAHYVYVAVPKSKRRGGYAQHLLSREGIGLIEIGGHYGLEARRTLPAKFQRPMSLQLRNALTDRHKELPGGHAGGGYITPYKLTMERVRDFMRRNGGREGWVLINEVLKDCETHYATPKPSLSAALRSFEAEWCEWKKENGRLYFRHRRYQP